MKMQGEVTGLVAARTHRRALCASLVSAALAIGACQPGLAQGPSASPASILFQNVRIFDGKSSALSAASNVLIRGNVIERISATPIALDGNANVRIIAGNGRVL